MVILRLLAALSLVSTAGCGGSSAVLQSNDAGGDGAAEGGGADASPTPPNTGVVQLTSVNATTANPPAESSTVVGGFALATTSSWCSPEVVVDGCSIVDCKLPLPPSPTLVSAGTVLVTGGKQPITLTAKKPDYTYSDQETLRLWDGGEELQLVVAGDVAPAFSLSLVAPAYVLVDAPVWPTGGTALSIPRAQDLKLGWSGGGAGNVAVRFTFTADTGTTFAVCQYPAQSGSGNVTAKVLGSLPTIATTGGVEITSETYVQATVSGWSMGFRATASANTPTGLASAAFVLQ